MGYPYEAGDEVLIGISWKEGSRYFRAATVIANDREAGRLVYRDDADGRYDYGVWSRDEGGFSGDEVVRRPADGEPDPWPRDPDMAVLLMRAGTHPDLACDYCGERAEYYAEPTADEGPARRCARCVTDISRNVHPIAERRA